MLKTRADFNNEDAYMDYTKSADFLCEYTWKGKTKEQIIHEMALPDYEQELLDEAMGYCGVEEKFLGIDLDRQILFLLDLGEDSEGMRIRNNLKEYYQMKQKGLVWKRKG